jgi:hypothetical protein
VRQREWEAKINRQQEIVENHALLKLFQSPGSTSNDGNGVISSEEQAARDFLTQYSNDVIKELTASWWQLFEQIITKFHGTLLCRSYYLLLPLYLISNSCCV